MLDEKNNSDIKSIQKSTFNVLCQIVDFFEKNEINYFIIGGTLLGAVRHKGFIPWDDDIDIGVPRNDYNKLISILSNLPNNLKPIHPTLNKETPFPFLVISEKSSILYINYKKPFNRGEGVDIFPIDNFPENSFFQKIIFSLIKFFRTLTMNKQQGFYKRNTNLKQRIHFIIISFFNIFLKRSFIFDLYDKIVSAHKKESYLSGNLYGVYGKKEVVRSEIFKSYKLLIFENRYFRAPSEPEYYLKKIYGDFMKPPCLSKQKSGHQFFKK